MSRTSKDGFPIRAIGIHNIIVDTDIQSRVQTDPEVQRDFSEAALRGDKFPPVTVFDDGEKFWLADGFHRHGAFLKAGLKEIECEVRPGARRDAIVFSAGANKEYSRKRSPEDQRKACEMLFADPEWTLKSSLLIGKHVGVSGQTVMRYRAAYHERTGTPMPTMIETASGRTCAALHAKTLDGKIPKMYEDGRFYKTINGKKVHLGRSREQAEQKIEAIRRESRNRASVFTPQNLSQFLARRAIAFSGAKFASNREPGLFGGTVRDHFVTWTTFEKNGDAVGAIGRAIAGAIFAGTTGRKVVLCDPETGPEAVIELGRQAGVEFISPEDFAASLQAQDDGRAARKAQ